MICETGRVVALEAGWIWVETYQATACKTCSAKAGCGQSLINSVFSGKRHFVRVLANGINEPVHLHDQVEIAIPEHAMLKGSFWLYIVPLLLLVTGAMAGNHLSGNGSDLYPMAGALGGFLLAILLVRWHAWVHQGKLTYQPVLHRIIQPASTARPLVFASL